MLKPNLVLVDAGTNNCNEGGTVPDAGANVTNLINSIYKQSPGATVILTTILVNSVAAQDACRVTVNEQVGFVALLKSIMLRSSSVYCTCNQIASSRRKARSRQHARPRRTSGNRSRRWTASK